MATREYSSSARQGPSVVAQTAVADAGRAAPAREVDTTVSDALQSLAKFGQQWAFKKFDQQAQEAYLSGERARATGQALEDVQHDTFMKPFVTAGWANQNYQLAQADLIGKAMQYIQGEGQSKTPEEFQQWLGAQTEGLSGVINDSMNVQDRAQALSAQTGTEQQLIQAHTNAYVKYNQQQYQQRVTTGGNAHLTAYMQAVRSGDQSAAQAAMGNVTEFATSLLANSTLPLEMRQKTVTDYLKTAVSETGSSAPVQALLGAGALDSLPADQRMEIDAAISKANQGVVTQARLNFSDSWSQFERQMQMGTATREQFQQMQNQAMQVGMPASWFDSANDKWYSSGQNSDNALAAQALARGDFAALGRTGKSVDQALESAAQMSFQQGATPWQAWSDSMSLGLRYGKVPKTAADALTMSIKGAIMNPDNQTPDQQKFLSNTIVALGRMQNDSPDKAAVMLQGFDADTQSTLVGVLDGVQRGLQPADALRQVVAAKSAFNAKSAGEKGAAVANLSKGVAQAVDSAFGAPWYRRAFDTALGRSGYDQSGWVKGQLNSAVSAEAQRLAALPQYTAVLAGNPDGQQALIKAAAANVQAKSLSIGVDSYLDGTPHSLLIPPGNTSVASMFGIDSSIPLDKDRLGNIVGKAMQDKIPKGWSAVYAVSPMDGSITMRAYDQSGANVSAPIQVDARALGAQYTKEYQDRVARERNGVQISVPTGDGSKQGFKLSGDGPGGMTSDEVIKFRRDLVGSEGLRLKVYKDTRGVLTGGVGQNLSSANRSPYESWKEGQAIPPSVAQTWFDQSSYNALSSARVLTNQYGFQDNARVQAALGKAVFQLGGAGWGKFTGAHEAIIRRDPEALEKSIRGSAWYKQTPKRANEFLEAMLPELRRSFKEQSLASRFGL